MPTDASIIAARHATHGTTLRLLQLFVISTTLLNWDLLKLAQGYGPGQAWNGNYFYLNWAVRTGLDECVPIEESLCCEWLAHCLFNLPNLKRRPQFFTFLLT